MPPASHSHSSRIVLTPIVLGITAVTTGIQLAHPELLHTFGRIPGALSQHQYWRLITPIFFHDEGWRQIIFNFVAIAIVGTIAERIFGRACWILLYIAGGISGNTAGFAWQPTGAGASVAGCGLLGGLAMWLLLKPPLPAKFGGAFILLGALAITFMRDIHGPALLAGGLLGLIFPHTREHKVDGEASSPK